MSKPRKVKVSDSNDEETDPQGEPELLQPEPALKSGSDDSGADILGKVGENMPDVQQNAVDAEKRREAESGAEETAKAQSTGTAGSGESSGGAPLDADGRTFNPDLHETNSDGSPRLSPLGKLRKKRGNGSAKTRSKLNLEGTAKPGEKVLEGTVEKPVAPVDQEARIAQAAMVSANVVFNVGVMLGGEEWAPQVLTIGDGIKVDERKAMQMNFADYYRVKGVVDIPPGVALVLGIMGYAAMRFRMPQTQSRWQKFKQWCKVKYMWYRHGIDIEAMAKPHEDKKAQEAKPVQPIPPVPPTSDASGQFGEKVA